MTRRHYLAAVIRFFLAQPAAPARAARDDWAVAQTLYTRGVSLGDFTHAVRIATLRRLNAAEPLPPPRRLAYYRQVLELLTPAERDPDYVTYVANRYQVATSISARSDRQNRALPDRH